jgi:hypothetical protein
MKVLPILTFLYFIVILSGCSQNLPNKIENTTETRSSLDKSLAQLEFEKKFPKCCELPFQQLPEKPLPAVDDDDTSPFTQSYLKNNLTRYAGYEINKNYNEKKEEVEVTVKRNGKKFLGYKLKQVLSVQSLELGLLQLIPKKTKQLVLMEYTGGMHCCWTYKIYDLSPKFRKIFDGDEYSIESIGYELHPIDIDGDGVYEFTQSVMAFDYFRVSHASSVFPTVVFAYSKELGEYIPKNGRFSKYLLRNMSRYLKDAAEKNLFYDEKTTKRFPQDEYVQAILRVVLEYIYAGQKQKGFEYFEKNYKMSDKDEFRKELKETLQKDPIYQSIY